MRATKRMLSSPGETPVGGALRLFSVAIALSSRLLPASPLLPFPISSSPFASAVVVFAEAASSRPNLGGGGGGGGLVGGPFRPRAVRNFVRQRCDGGGILEGGSSNDGASGEDDDGSSSSAGGLGDGAAVWVYEGSLVDPNTGNTVAEVEGMELVRHLSECSKSNSIGKGGGSGSGKRGRRRMGELLARDMLFGGPPEKGADEGAKKEPPEWDYAATVLSRKLFCYRAPERRASSPSSSDSDDAVESSSTKDSASRLLNPQRSLLRSIRLHPHSPLRRIPLDQTAALYDTATTYVSRDGGNEMAVLTEWPDGRWILGTARAGPADAVGDGKGANVDDSQRVVAGATDGIGGTFDFSVQVRRSTNDRPELRPLRSSSAVAGRGGKKKTPASEDVVISPPRSKLVEFGRDSTAERYRYSARETYSYNLPSADAASAPSALGSTVRRLGQWSDRARSELALRWNRALGNDTQPINEVPPADSPLLAATEGPTVRYSRYGECPPWYGPGRTCALELRGRRVRSVADAPALVATLAADKIPGFAVVNAPLPTGLSGKRKKGGVESDEGWLLGAFYSWRRRRANGGSGGDQREDPEVLLAQTKADAAAIRAVRRFKGTAPDSIPLKLIDDYDLDLVEGDDVLVRARKRRLAMGQNEGGAVVVWRERMNFAREDAGRWAAKWGGRIWDATKVNAGTGGSSSSSQSSSSSSGWSAGGL